MIILDTNVLSELMKESPNPRVLHWVDDTSRSDLAITTITVAEILSGLGLLPDGSRKKQLVLAASTMLNSSLAARVLPFDDRAARRYAEVVIQRRESGTPISTLDAQIASICRSRSAGIATRNVSDFEGLGIVLANPWTD